MMPTEIELFSPPCFFGVKRAEGYSHKELLRKNEDRFQVLLGGVFDRYGSEHLVSHRFILRQLSWRGNTSFWIWIQA
jgi:hypothetical protein